MYEIPFSHRRAKIIRKNNIFSSPSTNIESKVSIGDNNAESRTLVSSNGSNCPDSDVGVRTLSNNINVHPPDSHDDNNSTIDKKLGHNNGLTPLGQNIWSTASSTIDSLAPSYSNVSMMIMGDQRGPSPPNFLDSSLISANSNSLGGILTVTEGLSLSHLDVHMNFDSIGQQSSKIGTTAINSNSSVGPTNSIVGNFSSQGYAGDISDSISCMSNQENIFEDILNELLPPSSGNSGTWQFTGKL